MASTNRLAYEMAWFACSFVTSWATARRLLNDLLKQYEAEAPKAMDRLEAGFDDATAVMALPEHYRRRLRTTNMVERLNRAIRRRERVIGIFPNVASATRLLGAYLMEQDEAWSSGHRYFNMDEYWAWKEEREAKKGPETPLTSTNDQGAAA